MCNILIQRSPNLRFDNLGSFDFRDRDGKELFLGRLKRKSYFMKSGILGL